MLSIYYIALILVTAAIIIKAIMGVLWMFCIFHIVCMYRVRLAVSETHHKSIHGSLISHIIFFSILLNSEHLCDKVLVVIVDLL